jgi:hypothetical protein
MPLTDELLRVSGSTGNPRQTFTGAGATNGTGVYVGANRLVLSELRIGGAVTGTSPTMDVKYQSSADGTTSFVDIPGAAHAQQTATQASESTVAHPDVIAFRVPNGRPYVRSVVTLGGTSPVFTTVSLNLLPPVGGVLAS